MNDVDDILDQLETIITKGMDNLHESPTIKVMRVIRGRLTECGMDPNYRDIFIAKINLSLGASMSETQVTRLMSLSMDMAEKFYHALREEGYNDQAISEMGHRFVLTIE